MPFDPIHSAPRPYMREGTAAIAALVATRPARDVLISVYDELTHRDRPAARRLRSEVAALLDASVPQPVQLPPPPVLTQRAEPVVFEVVPCAHGEVLPEYRETVVTSRPAAVVIEHDDGTITVRSAPASDPAPQPAKRAKRAKLPAMTREENQAARAAFNRLRWAAEAAAEREIGRDACGQAVWAGVPGAAHMIQVPPSVSQYVALNGKVQKGARFMVLPAPRFWPGGALPEGYADLGEHVARVQRKSAPGSKAWRKSVLFQMQQQVGPAEKAVKNAIANYADLRRLMRGVMGNPGFRQGNGLVNWRAWIGQAWTKRAAVRLAQARLAQIKASLA